jgi:hypothetical protein
MKDVAHGHLFHSGNRLEWFQEDVMHTHLLNSKFDCLDGKEGYTHFKPCQTLSTDLDIPHWSQCGFAVLDRAPLVVHCPVLTEGLVAYRQQQDTEQPVSFTNGHTILICIPRSSGTWSLQRAVQQPRHCIPYILVIYI